MTRASSAPPSSVQTFERHNVTTFSYRFFGVHVLLRSDSPAILEHFQQVYARFVGAGAPRPYDTASPTILCEVLAESEDGEPVLILNGQIHRITPRHLLLDYAHTMLLNAVFARVDDHFLIHGASLSWSASDGARGLSLAGGAGLGKTTLALALTQRGLRFLSDDVAALNCADRLLYPFPRRLGLRPDTWRLCDLGPAPSFRQWVDITTFCGDCLGTPCSPKVLIVLDNGRSHVGRPGNAASSRRLESPSPFRSMRDDAADGRLYLTLDRRPADLEQALGQLGNIETEVVPSPAGYVTLSLQPFAGCRVNEDDIQRICTIHDTLLLDVDKAPPTSVSSSPPDFTASPRLVPLSPGIAALMLLSRLRGGERSALLQQTFAGSPARLYTALAALTGGMKCYRLTVGRLEEMIGLIQAAISSNSNVGQNDILSYSLRA